MVMALDVFDVPSWIRSHWRDGAPATDTDRDTIIAQRPYCNQCQPPGGTQPHSLVKDRFQISREQLQDVHDTALNEISEELSQAITLGAAAITSHACQFFIRLLPLLCHHRTTLRGDIVHILLQIAWPCKPRTRVESAARGAMAALLLTTS